MVKTNYGLGKYFEASALNHFSALVSSYTLQGIYTNKNWHKCLSISIWAIFIIFSLINIIDVVF